MSTDLLELSDSIITGRTSIESRHPVAMMGVTELHELAEGLAFVESFANVTAFDVDDRLLLIDAGCDKSAKDQRGWGAIDHARNRVDARRDEVVKYLEPLVPASTAAAPPQTNAPAAPKGQ